MRAIVKSLKACAQNFVVRHYHNVEAKSKACSLKTLSLVELIWDKRIKLIGELFADVFFFFSWLHCNTAPCSGEGKLDSQLSSPVCGCRFFFRPPVLLCDLKIICHPSLWNCRVHSMRLYSAWCLLWEASSIKECIRAKLTKITAANCCNHYTHAKINMQYMR